MFDSLISFFIIATLGAFFRWKKLGGISSDVARHVINAIVINFLLPALCFKVIATAPIDKNSVLLPASAIITILLSLLISFAIYTIIEKFTTLNKKEKGALILAASFGNVTFLGLLLLTGLYGQSAAKYVLLYDFLATTPLLWPVGATIASYYGQGQKLTFKESSKIIAELPPVWAFAAGFTANFLGIHLPNFLLKTLDIMSMAIIPLMMFSIGLALSTPKLKHAIIATPAIIIKLCLVPLIAFGTALLLGMGGLALKSTVMEAAMPTMIFTSVISSQYKLDHALSAVIIVLSTIISLITLPLISWLLRGY
ncbi:AEC family transporter [Candidatus Endomicrobiellum agilis]|uniref:AEC family transporter n=1 Tax=Candidatus Endomicrobiellum agilis TaxID=3238957 RepID=UPI0035799447|nr:AEC family transporter [Endomicrobium sp.]